MKEITVKHIADGDVAKTVVNARGMTATLFRVGDIKNLTVSGRGNVRQLKAITRALAKV
ncbi:hypothetical protein [Pantoea vagans]|uniref:hypothetical protein n=1 Tax=Pantoea vagans TaxID=470934 RepID=UPI00187230EF|nr:hypothetical protein [Pantoea vagans]